MHQVEEEFPRLHLLRDLHCLHARRLQEELREDARLQDADGARLAARAGDAEGPVRASEAGATKECPCAAERSDASV